MKFKAKLRKIGNSVGIYVPREALGNYQIGQEIEFDTTQVITNSVQVPIIGTVESETGQITFNKKFNTEMCPKHPGSMKGTCGCQ